MRPYVIRQGDFLSKLAFRFGFDVDEVWNHPKNAELKAKRPDMNVLFPGDLIFLPETSPPKLDVVAESSQSYLANPPKVEINLVLGNEHEPYGGCAYVIEGGAEPSEGTTDGKGKLTFKVPVVTQSVTVRLTERQLALRVKIGHMDPAEETGGIRLRLMHLGYLGGHAGHEHPEDDYARALGCFQADQKLPVTGVLDEQTRAALVKSHGS